MDRLAGSGSRVRLPPTRRHAQKTNPQQQSRTRLSAGYQPRGMALQWRCVFMATSETHRRLRRSTNETSPDPRLQYVTTRHHTTDPPFLTGLQPGTFPIALGVNVVNAARTDLHRRQVKTCPNCVLGMVPPRRKVPITPLAPPEKTRERARPRAARSFHASGRGVTTDFTAFFACAPALTACGFS